MNKKENVKNTKSLIVTPTSLKLLSSYLSVEFYYGV